MLIKALVFLGASNMENYSTSGIGYPGGWTPDANFKIWTGSAFETYNPGNNTGDSGRWGPEAGYIAAYKANHAPQTETLYILKHAKGSCGLAKKSGATCDWNPFSTGKQFEAAYNKIVGGLNNMQAGGKKAIIPTFFVANGETDSSAQADADAYFNNMIDLAEGLRGRMWLHNAKFILARIQDAAPNGAYRGTVRDAQDRFGTGFKQATVDTDDLALSGSPLHFSPAATVTLGERFYWAEQAIV